MRLTRPRVRHATTHQHADDPRPSTLLLPRCPLWAARPPRSHHRAVTPPTSAGPGNRRSLPILTAVVVLVLVLAGPAHAQTATLALAGSIDQVLDNIRNWLMGVLATLATVFLTVGGVRRVMGGGDPGEQEKAKTCFKSAAIGYGLAALAPLVVSVLKGIVGA